MGIAAEGFHLHGLPVRGDEPRPGHKDAALTDRDVRGIVTEKARACRDQDLGLIERPDRPGHDCCDLAGQARIDRILKRRFNHRSLKDGVRRIGDHLAHFGGGGFPPRLHEIPPRSIAALSRGLGHPHTGIPCPEIIDIAEHGGRAWLLMSALPGTDLASMPERDPRDIARILGRALRTLHELDPADCPFDHRIDQRLALARRRLDAGLYDGDDPSHGETDYAMAFSTRPSAEDLVVTHGDACLPNLLAQDGSFTGFVDCGRLGVADRDQDLALACRSFARNCGSANLSVLLDAYGIAEPDPQKLAWYSLLDEFF